MERSFSYENGNERKTNNQLTMVVDKLYYILWKKIHTYFANNSGLP